MSEKSDIYSLIIKAQEGNQKAFNSLLNTYWKDIYYFQFNKCNNEDEAEDITIKTFARAFDKISSFNPNFKFKTWLYTISNNLYIDHLRKQKTETVSIHKDHHGIHRIIDEEPSPADQLIQQQNLSLIHI